MLITAFILTLNFSFFHTTPKAAPTCGIHIVSYRFVGEPGTEFSYGGSTYVVPASGWIELLAKRQPANYLVSGRELPLDVWPADEFGTRKVPLPQRHRNEAENQITLGGVR